MREPLFSVSIHVATGTFQILAFCLADVGSRLGCYQQLDEAPLSFHCLSHQISTE